MGYSQCYQFLFSVFFFCFILHFSTANNVEIIMPQSFQVEIQWNLIENKTTIYMKEFYQKTNESTRGSMIIWAQNRKIQIIYDYTNAAARSDDLVIINDTICYLNKDKEEADFFLIDGQPVFSLSHFYELLPKSNKSSEEISFEGIPTKRFDMNNLNFQNTIKATYNLQLYFSNPSGDWNLPECDVHSNCTIPLKAILNRTSDDLPFTSQFIFFNYKENVSMSEEFQVPQGVYCPKATVEKKLPMQWNDFTAETETIFNAKTHPTSKTKVYYNHKLKYTRQDQIQFGNLNTCFVDHSRGIEYEYSSTEGLKVSRLNESYKGACDKMSRGLLSLLTGFVHNDAFYVGTRTIRSLECDVWVSTDADDRVFEVYMTKIKQNNFTDKDYIPVFANITDPSYEKDPKAVQRHIFNFYKETPNDEVFDVASYFDEKYKLRFQIDFLGPFITSKNAFLIMFRQQIGYYVGISTFRIQENMINIVVKHGEVHVLFTATLLEDIDNIDIFSVTENQQSLTNQQAYNVLYQKIANKEINIKFQFNNSMVTLKAIGITDRILPTVVDDDPDILLEMYKAFHGKEMVREYEYEYEEVSVFDCVRSCRKEKSFECKSFSYCNLGMGSCRVSSKHWTNEDDPNFKQNSACNSYSRYFLYDFSSFPGKRMKTKDGETPQNEESLESCANHCSQKEDFYCEGFNVCHPDDESIICEYLSHHMFDVSPDQLITDANCSIYSRNYLADFTPYENETVMDRPTTIQMAASAEDCARLCAASVELNECSAFEMCQSKNDNDKKTECILQMFDQNHPYPDPYPHLQKDVHCDHYERVHDLPSRHKPHNNNDTSYTSYTNPTCSSQHKTTTISLLTPGDMGGLAVGMLLIGFLLGGMLFIITMRLNIIRVNKRIDSRS